MARKRTATAARETATAAEAAWRARHPERAKAERALRKERAATIEMWGRKANGTAETHAHAARQTQGPLNRMYQTGDIDADQLAWAIEIAGVAERIGREVSVRTASLETRIDHGGRDGGGFHEALGQVRREMAYSAWRRMLGNAAGPVLDMIVGQGAGPIGLAMAATAHGMHHRRAKRLLIAAIDAWPGHYADARRRVGRRELDHAHAALN